MWGKVKKYVRFLRWIPFLRMVAVCNNLAFSNVRKTSDIDLFIVAKEGRLFLVRILVIAVLHCLGVRLHGEKIAGRFCLSFFVDDSFLNLSSIAIENDVYLKLWIKTLVPVIDDGVSKDFFLANSWVNGDFEEFDGIVRKDREFFSVNGKFKSFMEKLLGGRFGNLLELRLKNWQIKRARLKASKLADSSNIIIGEHILKFHENDRRREYRGLWKKRFGDVGVSLEKFKDLLKDV